MVDATNLNINYEKRVEFASSLLKHTDILLRKWQFKAIDALDILTTHLINEAQAQQELALNNLPSPPLSPVSTHSSSISPINVDVPMSQLSQMAPLPAQITSTPRSSVSTAPSIGVRASLQLSESSSADSSRQISCASTKEVIAKDVILGESLECLLIFRGFLLATLLESGPDTSMLIEPDFQNEIMKVM